VTALRTPTVVVTGGAGYVGSELVPHLLGLGYRVRVLDLYLYGEDVFAAESCDRLEQWKGDIRDVALVREVMAGANAVIHLACISNDPSYDLDPELGRSINYDAFDPLVRAAKSGGVRRFIYASSSSVYGVRSEPNVTEEIPLAPLTDYSKYKAECETLLVAARSPGFETVIVRPSTVCGYGRRLRLDLVVNILTNHAYHNRILKVFGGTQLRPNIHIRDMVELYANLLQQPSEVVDGEIFNAGFENRTVLELASIVNRNLGGDIPLEILDTDDRRSYHVSSDKMRRRLGFEPRFTIDDAVAELVSAFAEGRVPDAMDNPIYYNIRRMKQVELH